MEPGCGFGDDDEWGVCGDGQGNQKESDPGWTGMDGSGTQQ